MVVLHRHLARPVVLAALMSLVACSQTVTDAPSPTPSADETPGIPSPSPAQTAAPSPSVPPAASSEATPATSPELRPDAVAQVVTTDLVVRSLPEISDSSVMDPVRLSTPTLLFILEGPVTADGYDWYLVAPFVRSFTDIAPEEPLPRLGWIAAASRDGEAWIAPARLDCPEPTVRSLQLTPGLVALACFGSDILTLEGRFGGCGVGDLAAIEPWWLIHASCLLLPLDRPDEPDGIFSAGMTMRHTGEVGMPYGSLDAAIRVVGHFDHPAARTCASQPHPDFEEVPSQLVILDCRSKFVVTEVSVLGLTP